MRGVALLAGGTLLLAAGCAGRHVFGISAEEAAGVCRGSAVEIEFDPHGRIEVRTAGETVASADVPSRRVSDESCAKTPVPRSFWQGKLHYARLTTRTTLTCRLPGRFIVHAYPVSASWAGERPAGSAVGLVLGRRLGHGPGPQRTILASATVLERSDESDLLFLRPYCRPTNR